MPRKTTKPSHDYEACDKALYEWPHGKRPERDKCLAVGHKLTWSYLDRLDDIAADVRKQRIPLAHAKVRQLMEACRSLYEDDDVPRDPCEQQRRPRRHPRQPKKGDPWPGHNERYCKRLFAMQDEADARWKVHIEETKTFVKSYQASLADIEEDFREGLIGLAYAEVMGLIEETVSYLHLNEE